MRKEVSSEVLDLLEKEVSLLSKEPVTVERQSLLISYHQILRFWRVKDEAETTSLVLDSELKEKYSRIFRQLVNLGAESVFELDSRR